jgi:phosphopantetheine adenylyltransferase
MRGKITKHHLKSIREKLPHRYVEELTERVNEKLQEKGEKPVSIALVQAVIMGHKNDYHDIITTAIEWAEDIEQKFQKMLEQTEKISKSA